MGFFDAFKGAFGFGGGGQKPGGGMGSAVGMPMGGGKQTPFTGGPAMGGGQPQMPGGWAGGGMNKAAQTWMQQQGGQMPGGQDHKAYIPVPFGFKDQAQRDQWKQQNDTQRQRVLAGEPDMMRGGNTGISGGGFHGGGLGPLAQTVGQAGSLAGSAPGDMKGEKDFGGNQEMASGDAGGMGGDAQMAQPPSFASGGWNSPYQMQKPRKFSGYRSMRGGRR